PVGGLGGLLGPGQSAGLLGPETEPVSLGLFVRLSRDVGVRGQVSGRREATLLPQKVGQALIAHGICLSQGVRSGCPLCPSPQLIRPEGALTRVDGTLV